MTINLISLIVRIVHPVYRLGTIKPIVLLLISFLLFTGSLTGTSQTREIDSLKLVAVNSSESGKINILLSIAEEYKLFNNDSAQHYGNKALDYALLLNNNVLVIESLMELAKINLNIGNNKRSIFLFNQAKQLSVKEDNMYLLAKVYMSLGRHYSTLSNYGETLSSLDTALNIIIDNKLTNLKPLIYNEIAFLYYLIHDYSLASYYSNLGINSSKNDIDKTNYIDNLLLHGNIFLQTNNDDSTLFYYNKALIFAKKSNNIALIQQSYRRISGYLIKKTEYTKANQYIDSSIYYCIELNLTSERAALVTYKAHVSSQNLDYKSALNYNLKALELRESTGHKSSICASILNIGGNYTKLGDYEKSYSYLRRGLELAKDVNVVSLVYAYDKLSELYSYKGNYEKALQYTELKEQYKDSITTNKTNEQVMFFRNQYKLEKEKTLTERIKLEKKTNESIFLIITIILALVIIILLSLFTYLRIRTTKEIIKLSKIIETSNQAVVITGLNSEVVYVNNGLLKMLGFSNENELTGRSIFELTNDEGEKLLSEEILPSLLEVGHWHGEMTYQRKNKTIFITEEICSIIYDNDDNPEFYVSIFNDITKRKETESSLKIIKENLEKTVQTKDKMFSIIAHDLTGPFSSILGLSEIMINEYDKYQTDDHIRFCKLIYNSSKHSFELLTNLLHWSRSQLGNIEIKQENVNIYDLVHKNAEPLILSISKKKITFQNKVDSDIYAYIDNNSISIVIRNLLSNAIKFTPRGGTITVTTNTTNSKVNIVFSDTGIGIEPEDISDLFKINGNKLKKGTENEKGTGLGLILCKEFTELNNGSIAVNSEVGKGSNFILTLPTK